MIGIILAAGDGTRYKKSSGKDNCKILSPLNNKYLIEFALSNLKSLNISDVFIVVGECAEAIKKQIGYNYDGIRVNYVNQPVRKGIINALSLSIKNTKDDDVILQLADEVFVDFRIEEIIRNIDENENDFLCGITYEANREKIKANYSVCVDENLHLIKCTEKPEIVTNNIKGTGFCVFNKQCVQLLRDIYDEKANKPYDLCDYMNFLVSVGKKGKCICVADMEFNINEHSDLTEAEKYYSDNGISQNCLPVSTYINND